MNKKLFGMTGALGTLALVVGATAAFTQPSATDLSATNFGARTAIVQNQADGPLFAPDNGPANFRAGRGGQFADVFDQAVLEEVAANALGITVDELQAAREAGTRMPDLAEELGVEVETVKAAVEAAKAEMVEQAVAAGTITAEEGEMILNGGPEGRNGRRGRGGPEGGGPGAGLIDMEAAEAAVANSLGISVDELQAAREAGTRLPELAAELGVDMADVEAAMETVKADAVAAAVADGTITAEQAERILAGDGRGGPGGMANNIMADIFSREDKDAVVADVLGITIEALNAAKEEGTRLPDLAAELGVEVEAIREAVDAAKTEAVNQAVADGLITAEQAEQILSHEGKPNGRGGRGGPQGGPQGGAPFAPNGAPATAPALDA
ncbi:MAG TPA: hypothetical protein VLL52_24615 [Anaerolineae bacterium]|nr:hypothetical protein [Anaerolineae bacterium]